jgi:hypothetical protein
MHFGVGLLKILEIPGRERQDEVCANLVIQEYLALSLFTLNMKMTSSLLESYVTFTFMSSYKFQGCDLDFMIPARQNVLFTDSRKSPFHNPRTLKCYSQR